MTFMYIFNEINMNKESVFITTKNYPELKILEDNWKVIVNEIPSFDINKINSYPKRPRNAWNNKEANELLKNIKSEWMRSWQKGDKWLNFPLIYHGKVIDKSDQICPNTIKLLQKIPSIQIAGYSILLPNSKLDVHTDLTGKKQNSMAYNQLLTDSNANLYVGNNKYKHKLGKAVIFDSNIEHYADNQDTKPRVILYIDFKTDIMYGSRRKGIGLAKKLGYPTINIKLNKPMNCGVYTGDSDYGKVTVFVTANDNAECHYLNYTKELDNMKDIYIWNVTKLPSEKNSIIDIYNKGCSRIN